MAYTKNTHICFPDIRYKTVEDSTNAHGVPPPVSWDVQDVRNWLLQHATSVHGDQAVDPERDLFEQGFDRYVDSLLQMSTGYAQNKSGPQLERDFPSQSHNRRSTRIPRQFCRFHCSENHAELRLPAPHLDVARSGGFRIDTQRHLIVGLTLAGD